MILEVFSNLNDSMILTDFSLRSILKLNFSSTLKSKKKIFCLILFD